MLLCGFRHYDLENNYYTGGDAGFAVLGQVMKNLAMCGLGLMFALVLALVASLNLVRARIALVVMPLIIAVAIWFL